MSSSRSTPCTAPVLGSTAPTEPVRADEPDPPVPVGQRGVDACRLHRARRLTRYCVDKPEPGLVRPPTTRMRPVGGRDHGAVPVVEVEVAAAGEVREEGEVADPAQRQVVGRQGLERGRVEQHQPGALKPDARDQDLAAASEGRGRRSRRPGRSNSLRFPARVAHPPGRCPSGRGRCGSSRARCAP